MLGSKEKYLSHIHRPEDEVFLRRLLDQIDQALTHKRVEATDFLNPHQLKLGLDLIKQFPDLDYSVQAGVNRAERKLCLFGPTFIALDTVSPLRLLQGNWDQKFGHKDVLGACLSLGLSRKKIGDIFFEGDSFYLVVKREIADFLLLEFKSIGRQKISLEEVDPATVERPAEKFLEKRVTVSSDRLDGVIAEAYHLSRSKANELIKRELVKVNFCVQEKASTPLKEDDLVSVRRRGRFIYGGIVGQTKKGRKQVRLLFLE